MISKIKGKIRQFTISAKKRRAKRKQDEAFPAGHYYSVIPDKKDIKERASIIFKKTHLIGGVKLNLAHQISTLHALRYLSEEKKFDFNQSKRFNIENTNFSFDDAPVLHYMLRKIKPKKIIEVGCGNSSALMMDTNEFYLDGAIQSFTFIDPNMGRFRSTVPEEDIAKCKMIEKTIQEVDLSEFENLESGDLLFIDSSHVSKIGSDLNTILFDIIPVLKKGVYIHFHDVRYPFEYTKQLIDTKVYWNEAYLLRAFLMYNESFELDFWLNCLLNRKETQDENFDFLPLNKWAERFNDSDLDFSGAGGSIYLRKIK